MNKVALRLLIVLLLPLLGLSALWGVQQIRASSGPVTRIEITGFDPRDLLYGHYLAFQFAPGAPAPWGDVNKEQQYFVPEKDAAVLDRALRRNSGVRFSVDVRGTPDKPVYGMLYIEDMPWRDYLRAHPNNFR